MGDFGELVLNAVALEFVLVIRNLIYEAAVSERSKLDPSRTKIVSEEKTHRANLQSFTKDILWFLVAILWVLLYMGIPNVILGWQMVLPNYKWDVRAVCEDWFEMHFCVDPPCEGAHSTMYYFLGFG